VNAPARIPHRNAEGANAGAATPLLPSLERRRLQCYLGLLVCDIAALLAGPTIAGHFYDGAYGRANGLLFAQLMLPVFLTASFYNGAYSILSLRKPLFGISRAAAAFTIALFVVQFIAFYAKANQSFSRMIITIGALLGISLMIWLRMQMRGFVRWRCGTQIVNILVIDDDGPPAGHLGTAMIRAGDFGLVPMLDDPHALDRIGMALRNADQVIVSCPPERRTNWAMILKGANIAGEVIDDVVLELGARGARTEGRHGLLAVSIGPLGLRSRVQKRMLDIVLAGSALIVLSPLLAITALAIWLEDGGPVLFFQRRMGLGNRFFAMAKFRSMQHASGDADGTVSASRTDDRVTRVGRFIRRTSIDELPQLYNVLAGDMSLVGPRPHAIGSQAGDKLFWEVDSRYWQRHALKPGITGLAQVRGLRGATDCEQDLAGRLEADLEYLRGWSIWRDIGILLATVRVLIHHRAF